MKEKPSWFKKNLPWLVSLLLVAVCTRAAFYYYNLWLPTDTDQANDEAGYFTSVFSPFIALAAAVITFTAFWIQYQANTEMRTRMDEQEKQQSIDRFEKIFFEMVHIHRENVLGFVIRMGDDNEALRGNAALSAVFQEVNDTYNFLKHSKQHNYATELASYDDQKLIRLAYELAWEGHSKDRDGNYMDVAPDCKDRSQGKVGILAEFHDWYRGPAAEKKSLLNSVAGFFAAPGQGALPATSAPAPTLPKGYPLGAGTKHALSTYYRHFYHTCKFLEEEHGLKDEEKKIQALKEKYASILRSQISDEAQGLMYYNSLSIRIDIWWGKQIPGQAPHTYPGLLMHFKLLRNAPLDKIDPKISPLREAVVWLKDKAGISTHSVKVLLPYFTYLDNPAHYHEVFADQAQEP